jgi:signal transduction histidine kinase/HAMP domain-containing protein
VTRRRSLFIKYAIPLVLLSSGAVIVSGLDQMYFSYQESKTALARVQHEKASAAAIRIEQFARDLEHQIAWIAQAQWGPRGTTLDQRRLDSQRLLRQVPAITEVSHLDTEGHEQLRVSRLAMDVVGSNTDLSNDPRFTEARSRKTWFSPVYFRKESEPYMTVALVGNGENAGVVAAEANLKFIWDVVSGMKVGQGGVAYVVDAKGRLIAHPDISLVLRNTDLSTLPLIRESIAQGGVESAAVQAITGHDVQGREVLSASAPIAPLGWNVLVDLPLSEALAPLYSSLFRTALLLLVGLVASVLASLILVRRMVAPIHVLQAGAARIGGGELHQRIDVKTGDELEALGEEFNCMAEQLEESYAGLERKVEERTKDLTESLEQQTATSEILRVISQSQTDEKPVFEKITQSCRRLFNSSQIGINLVRPDGLVYLAAYVGPEESTLREMYPFPIDYDTGTGKAMKERRALHYLDALAGDDVPPRVKHGAERIGARSVVFAPLIREDQGIGAIFVSRSVVSPFSEREIALLQTFADQAVIAIENVRLFQELQSRTEQLGESVEQFRALAEVSQAVNSTLDLDQVLSTIVSRAVQLSGTSSGAVYEYEEADEQLRLRATYGLEPDVVETMLAKTLRVGEGAAGEAAQMRAPVEIANIGGTDLYEGELRKVIDRAGVRSLLAIPLLREGRVLGALTVSRRFEGTFPAEVTTLLQTFAAQSAVAIQNARLFREIEQKSRELEVASQHKSQFLANMSHELRTPLNAILGYTELIVDKIYGEVPDKITDVLERVQKSGRHLLGLINDVLDLSKIEAGQLTLTLSDYSVHDAVQSAVTAVESLAREKGLRLVVDVAAKLPVGRADERRVVQVLLNLVGNAIKFTEEGEVAIRVRRDNELFVVSVSDTGAGIPKAQHERIFEEFQQADGSSTRTNGGTGLGLAIARKIIELHGGRIWVESVVGEGSTFTFSVPVQAGRRERSA